MIKLPADLDAQDVSRGILQQPSRVQTPNKTNGLIIAGVFFIELRRDVLPAPSCHYFRVAVASVAKLTKSWSLRLSGAGAT